MENLPVKLKILLQKWHREDGWIVDLLALGIILNLVLLIAASLLHIGTLEPGWKGFYQKLNWLLYPAFWLVIAWLAHNTWHPYLSAWYEMRNRCLIHYGASDDSILLHRKDLCLSDDDYGELVTVLQRWRRVSFRCALVVSGCIATIDSWSVWRQLYLRMPNLGNCGEPDFTIAALSNSPRLRLSANVAFDVGVYLMEGVLIALAFCALFQVCIHLYWFSRIEKSDWAKTRTKATEITLDPRDHDYRFGLIDWNEAVTGSYYLCALGMLIPLLSYRDQPAGCVDIGQWLMRLLIPMLLIAPGAGPIWLRLARVKKVRKLVDASESEIDKVEMRKQRIWPWDQHKLVFAALAAIIIEYFVFLGKTWEEALKLLRG